MQKVTSTQMMDDGHAMVTLGVKFQSDGRNMMDSALEMMQTTCGMGSVLLQPIVKSMIANGSSMEKCGLKLQFDGGDLLRQARQMLDDVQQQPCTTIAETAEYKCLALLCIERLADDVYSDEEEDDEDDYMVSD